MSEFNIDLFHILNTVSTFEVNPPQRLSHILNVVNTFTYTIEHGFYHHPTVLNQFSFNIARTQQISHTLNLRSQFTFSIDNPSFIGTPIPPIDKPPINSDPGTTTPPGVGPLNIGALRYEAQLVTFASGVYSITFKAPDFGDKNGLDFKEINQDSRGLTLIQFKDEIWANYNTYEISFSQIDEDEANAIKIFLRNTVGKNIIYTDIYGNSHNGFIPDPDAALISSIQGFGIKFTFLEAVAA